MERKRQKGDSNKSQVQPSLISVILPLLEY